MVVPGAKTRAELLSLNRSMTDHVAELRSRVVGRDTMGYVHPDSQQRSAFRALADGLHNARTPGDLSALTAPASAIGYDVVQLSDGGTVYYGLQESLVGGETPRGWGSFFLRQNAARNALVEVVHPLADINTWEISARAFVDSQAKGFLMSGAHRNANGNGTADVGQLMNSVFQEVHQSFSGGATDVSAWQVHGFNLDLHAHLPSDTDAILSSGTGGISEIILELDQNIDDLNGAWTSYSYNTLDPADVLNVATNGTINGAIFDGLGGRSNAQQLYTTSIGGQFVHVELEQSFRIDGGDAARELIANALARSITLSATAVPEPGSVMLTGMLATFSLVRRRRSVNC